MLGKLETYVLFQIVEGKLLVKTFACIAEHRRKSWGGWGDIYPKFDWGGG